MFGFNKERMEEVHVKDSSTGKYCCASVSSGRVVCDSDTKACPFTRSALPDTLPTEKKEDKPP